MSNPPLIKRFPVNPAGRDFAVGDIHGHFTRLQQALDAIGFDPAVDRLFSVGDLVDRGPESEDSYQWIDKPWFHPVRGNHDDYVCRFDTCDIGNWLHNGGYWFMGRPTVEQQCYQVVFQELPIVIEVETPDGVVGLVHADCPFASWGELIQALERPVSIRDLKLLKNACMWSRSRIENDVDNVVEGIRAVVCGHTPVRQPVVLGNVYHIDTGGWFLDGSGYFTLLDLHAMTARPAIPAKLEW